MEEWKEKLTASTLMSDDTGEGLCGIAYYNHRQISTKYLGDEGTTPSLGDTT